MAHGSSIEEVTFAVVGDYGKDNAAELAVSRLVKDQLQPDFIVTVGDDTYGRNLTPDTAIGKYYSDYIGDYKGIYGPGSDHDRFFPALGNHDWDDGGGLRAYLDYFTLPGNERYYEFTQGPVQFFVLDSDPREPDGTTANSVQAQWLQQGLASSTAEWQIVVAHHPPYSSGAAHGPEVDLRWPYEQWGVDAVLSGHEHNYERLLKDDNEDGKLLPYFINGLGGASLSGYSSVDPDSAVRYNATHGAMLVHATDTEITFELWSDANELIDTYTIIIGNPVGTDASETLEGSDGPDTIMGLGGDDKMFGKDGQDVLNGGVGDDQLDGGSGADRLSGGGGADDFVFTSVKDSGPSGAKRDRIEDFGGQDEIVLRKIDADRTEKGNQTFELDQGGGFDGGEIRVKDTKAGVVLEMNIDNDARAEMSLLLVDFHGRISDADFLF